MTRNTFSCLDHHFSVEVSDPELSLVIAHLYDRFRSNRAPDVDYTVVQWQYEADLVSAVFVDGHRAAMTRDPAALLAHLVWEINNRVIGATTPHELLLHASAAERDGQAVLMPAPSGSGKSTLVSGLVAAGFGYLTDDVAVMSDDNLQPYPKPIALAAHLHDRFDSFEAPPFLTPFLGEHGFVAPEDLGGHVGVPAEPRLVVVPAYSPGAPNHLVELPRVACLKLLIEQSFNAATLGGVAMPSIARALEGCHCYRLEYDDLARGVELVSEALGRAASAFARH
ncbi:MAG: hypothetical protein KDB02_15435 [Acidimicrobiales bacterium]|nr:hypothetical protein [Acidimicrobiales bacterium]